MSDTRQPIDADDLLGVIRGERGYTLSYHELLARTDPHLLSAYRNLYREFTLVPRHLDERRRELIWAGLLTIASEHVGSLHLERALKVGVEKAELRSAVALAGVCESWTAFAFAHGHWADLLGSDDHAVTYRHLVTTARGQISEADAELVLLTCAGSRMVEDQFAHHLRHCYAMGLAEEDVVEAVSYLLLPCGANTLLWAMDVYLDQIKDGAITAGPLLQKVSHDVRRR